MITSPRIMSNESRGIIMCSGKGLMIHTLVLIRQTRRMLSINATSSESVSILVAHCNELVDLHDRAVRREGGDGLMDICPGVPPVKESKLRDGSGSISGPRSRSHLSGTQKQNSSSSLSASDISRRRSFFCKPAALLLSPFTHTMLVDHDVIWFKNPALLWDAPGYVHTGALYFLDRFIPYDNRYKDGIRGASALVSQYWGRNISLSLSLSLSRTVTYWRHHYNISSVRPKHVQDSSVVMINREKHKGTLSTISSLLSNFTVGYGDKEIYWLASTIANQSFAFEPYWPGVYGDCGAVFHFDPRYFPPSIYPFPSLSSSSSSLSSVSTEPFFINAQYLVEHFKRPGSYIESHITVPRLYLTTDLGPLGAVQPCTGGRCGAFSSYGGSMSVTKSVNKEILLRQEELEMGVPAEGGEDHYALPIAGRRRPRTLHTRNCNHIEGLVRAGKLSSATILYNTGKIVQNNKGRERFIEPKREREKEKASGRFKS